MHRLTRLGPYTRILVTVLIAAGVYAALSGALTWQVRLLVAWCGGALFFLVQVGSMFTLLDAEGVKARCQGQLTEGHASILVGVVLVAMVSIVAVIYLLGGVDAHTPFYRLHVALSPIVIASSWLILQSMFAVYYAKLYYRTANAEGEGLRWPTREAPDYWDFLYFSCTLATSYGLSDIAITARHIRRVSLVQILICFFYYTAIVGLVMNVIGTVF
jgi:uncharacterized membrane protein